MLSVKEGEAKRARIIAKLQKKIDADEAVIAESDRKIAEAEEMIRKLKSTPA